MKISDKMMSSSSSTSYTDLHRGLAQLLLCHGVLEESCLKSFYQMHVSTLECKAGYKEIRSKWIMTQFL
jgi:hypothetical protein